MHHALFLVCCTFLLSIGRSATAQHCQPIYESYLGGISVKQKKGIIKLDIDYVVTGGPGHKAYQAYIIAYLEKDAARVPAPAPKDVIDKKVALVLHTQLIKQNEDGDFNIKYEIAAHDLAAKMIAFRKLTEKDREVVGGWGQYNDHIRLAVFVPLLDDKKYSVIDGLPKDRHYCNYEDDRALLFQTLPYRLSMHFGIVQAWRKKAGQYAIQINGDKPVKRKG